MSDAADASPSGMAALLGVDVGVATNVVEASVANGGSLQIANINAPGQVVVAGSVSDLEWLAESGKDLGVRRSIPLKVAGAFHSNYMTSAAEGLESAVSSSSFRSPGFPVWANATAKPYSPMDVASTLVAQVTSPVLFEATLQSMAEAGLNTFVHVGPGDVTAGLAKRTLPDATVLTVSDLEDIESAAAAVGTM
jgi:[acyl-carrier-protein] S-malonyltransferase